MSQSNNSPQDPIEEQISALLARAANNVSPAPDFARQVRRAATGYSARRLRPSLSFSLGALKPFGSVALIALVVVAFAWALVGRGWSGLRFTGPAHGASTPIATPAATSQPTLACDPAQQHYPTIGGLSNPTDHSIALGASATDQGITVTVERVYADATQTVVQYDARPDNTYYSAFSVSLIDASGASYGAFSGGSGRLSNNHMLSQEVFTPLPQSALGTPQRLRFRVTKLMGDSPTGNEAAPAPTLNGLWDIPFTITPVAGTAIPVTLPAQSHDGITIQVEEVDLAPAGGGLDGQSGGVRVRYRVSNLPATASVFSVVSFPIQFTSTSGGSGGAPGGAACHDLLTLTFANGQKTVPGSLSPVIPGASGHYFTRTVGASGAIEVEAVFFAPVAPGNLTMTINRMAIGTVQQGTPGPMRLAQGPWVFDIPVHS